MSRPTDDPQWATNTNYGAGSYSGNANKSRPSAGVIAEGFDPGAGIPAEWLNYWFSNHGLWLKYHDDQQQLASRVVHDHFTGSALDTSKFTSTGSGTASIVDDSSSGAVGALQIDIPASTATTNDVKTCKVPIGTVDFRYRAKARVSIKGDGSVTLGIIPTANVSTSAYVWTDNTHANWQVTIAGTSHDTGIAADGNYRTFDLIRTSGSVTCYVDGVSNFTSAMASSISATQFATMEVTGVSTHMQVFIDFFSFWYDISI